MPTLTSYDAHTRNALATVEITTAEQIPALINDSKKAQTIWAALSLTERQQLVTQAYQRLEPVQNQLAILISKEMGKDYRRATYEAGGTIQSAAYFANEIAQALTSEQLEHGTELQYRPLGIVAVISPWNYPLAMANNLLMPALLAGNSVILKPSEETPLVADLFVNSLNQILPEGVLQLAHGDKQTGRALVASNINMVAFTGSMSAGKDIMANAAPKLKRLVMELGGNDPMIVMASADIDAAVQFAVASAFENAGQMCTSTERVYVDARIAKEFEHKVVALARQYQVGAWDKPHVNIGPLVNPVQHQKVLEQLQDATAKGAQLLLGSDTYPQPFIQPTVVTGITPDMRLEQDETFGPVVAISPFKEIGEAITRANDSPYGLGAVVFGGQGANAVAEQLEAGMVGINQGVGGGNAPWVGAKQSGFGFHGSAAGHRQFAQVRVISK
ncbi:MAG: aldehyde dehydrogenase family protein [Moritella sp.]|uniref:aldehyde dehydrogenase family protein n=1 Tax=Moritella sp. TaxID=78556 RepID=UPI0029B5FA84|nr:aldehyde dehydrogenase family protein [Moritella sp.]MDX2322037.1 aldehyde dehydrogenase family protein [Moritella sp.]